MWLTTNWVKTFPTGGLVTTDLMSGLAIEADVLVTVVTVDTVETGTDVIEAFVTVDVVTTLGPD